MRKVILYIALSLDGYIARENGDVDWLPQNPDQDYGYYDFYESVDTIIMGRKTYDQALSFGDWPYKEKRCLIFSRSARMDSEDVSFTTEPVDSLISALTKQSGKHIWLVGGTELVEEFIQHDLIDEYRLFIMPIILGGGIPLFKNGLPETKVTFAGQKTYSDGFVELVYTRAEVK